MSSDLLDFSVNLNCLPIFQQFYNNVSSKISENRKSRRIFDIKNDVFYLCDVFSADIYVTRTSSFIKNDMDHRYQVYKIRANGEVRGSLLDVRASNNYDQIALITDEGLYVANLPHVRTTCMLATVPYYNKYSVWKVPHPREHRMHSMFVYEVERALWHPNREDLLFALFNDNYLRIYDVPSKTLQKIISLGRHPVHPLSTIYALGDGAIDFDFLPTTDDNADNAPLLVTKRDGTIIKISEPLETTTDISESQIDLQVLPNYCYDADKFHFVDSMAILFTDPVIVVLTFRATVFHCYLVEVDNQEVLLPCEQYDLMSVNPSDTANTSLTLIKDTSDPYRFYILHGYGLHAVLLPNTAALLEAFDILQPLDLDEMTSLLTETHFGSIVVHVFAPSDSCLLKPGVRELFGVAVMPDRATGSTLIVMDPECCVLSLNTNQLQPPPPVVYSHNSSTSSQESFTDTVQQILNPPEKKRTLFKYEEKKMLAKVYGKSLNNPPSKVVEEVNKLRSQLSAVHIRSQEEAMKEIDLKTQDLLVETIFQEKQLETLKLDKDSLKSNAERIAEKYEELNDKLTMQQKRFDALNLRIQAPVKSMAEEKMKREVHQCYEKYLTLQKAMHEAYDTLKKTRNMLHHSTARPKPGYLDPETRKCVHRDLTAMYEQIKSTVERVRPIVDYLNSTNAVTKK